MHGRERVRLSRQGRNQGKKRRAKVPKTGHFCISWTKMMHTSSMASRIRRRQARIAIFAASLERQNRRRNLLQPTGRSPEPRSGSLENREQRSDQQQFAAEYI